jgi:hypothetical protein
MSSTAAATGTAIPVERRFPLSLRAEITSIRALYETSKVQRWDPDSVADWGALRADVLAPEIAQSARAVWSRRAWLEYTGLAETPALLIRLCLEADRESDPKYYLTVRSTEEAWHVDCLHRLAQGFGGYIDRPADARWEAVFNQTLYREALSAATAVDAYMAVRCAVEDGLEYELYDAYLGNARHPVVRDVLTAIARDKRRHAEFGWLYLQERAARMSADDRAGVAQAIDRWRREVHEAGYLVASLNRTLFTPQDAQDMARVAQAGLGGLESAAEEALAAAYLDRSQVRLREMGITPTY